MKIQCFISLLAVTLLTDGVTGLDITSSLNNIPATGDGADKPTGLDVKVETSNTSEKDASLPSNQESGPTSEVGKVSNPTGVDGKRSGLGFGSDFFSNGWFFDSSHSGFSTLHSTINCSEPNNPSTAFAIGVDGTAYPTALINNEIINRPNFAQFLVQEIPGPIVVPPDATFDSANRTCPGVAFNVFSFNSATRGGCWVLQGFQDPLFTVVCQAGDCVGCSSSHSSTSSYVGTTTSFKYRCIPQYKSISVWAYCPLLGFPAIVREQVIVPSFCSCLQTPCTKTTTSSGW